MRRCIAYLFYDGCVAENKYKKTTWFIFSLSFYKKKKRKYWIYAKEKDYPPHNEPPFTLPRG